jgi:hypothetical protein
MINLSDIVTDPDLAQTFTVYRSTGQFVNGRWVENDPEIIPMTGVIVVATPKVIQFLGVGDRVTAGMAFFTREPLYLTRVEEDENGTSDKALWHRNFYKLIALSDFSDYGFYSAVGERIKGD